MWDYDVLAMSKEERECDYLEWQEIAKTCSGAVLSATQNHSWVMCRNYMLLGVMLFGVRVETHSMERACENSYYSDPKYYIGTRYDTRYTIDKASLTWLAERIAQMLRLNEARRLMLADHLEASKAAFEVGYESPSQFSREYSRLFGAPPIQDIKKLVQDSAN